MIGAAAVLAFPLVSVFPYRRAGLTWTRAIALAVLAVVLAGIGAAGAVVYRYVIDIGASLCGSTPIAAGVAALAAYLVVAAWAVTRPRRVWGWVFAPLSGAAILILASYFFAGAHAYCET